MLFSAACCFFVVVYCLVRYCLVFSDCIGVLCVARYLLVVFLSCLCCLLAVACELLFVVCCLSLAFVD